jgi:polyisoprenyl-teichoic acid--peptidoglycan teichoic acid transferase
LYKRCIDLEVINEKRKILFPIVIILTIAIISGGAYFTINSKLSKINITKISKNPSDLGITVKQSINNYISKNYTSILLLGVDSRDPLVDPGLADSIMILTLDKVHNKIKVTSLMRDMLIDNIHYKSYLPNPWRHTTFKWYASIRLL